MAETLKRLGANDLAATTNTDVYTAPASTQAVASSVSVCNRTAGNLTFRLSHLDAATGAPANEDYFVYDQTILANSSQFFQLGITMAATDTISAYASNTGISVIVWGSEIA